jgi:hypothetical protein
VGVSEEKTTTTARSNMSPDPLSKLGATSKLRRAPRCTGFREVAYYPFEGNHLRISAPRRER